MLEWQNGYYSGFFKYSEDVSSFISPSKMQTYASKMWNDYEKREEWWSNQNHMLVQGGSGDIFKLFKFTMVMYMCLGFFLLLNYI